MIKKISLSLSMLIISVLVFAQDDIKVMQYNLLNYGNITSYCTTTNNNMADKEQYLRTIIDYVQPDIFCVNEIANISYVHQRLLDSALNFNSVKQYQKSGYVNTNGSDLVNMLYYNTAKFVYVSAESVQNHVRDIVLYRLYYNSPNLAQTQDTAWVNFIVGHLKAGSSTSDKASRATMTADAMSYLVQHNYDGNNLFMGDFNIRKSSEQSYENLLNYSNSTFRFYDPINRSGTWNNSSSFADIHTQSTHSSSGCAASGGMDDRFDFILISDNIKNNSAHVSYKPGSYFALGNDGNHFNQSINSGTNNSAPANIIDALYNLSDHLPVIMELHFDSQVSSLVENTDSKLILNYQNPIDDILEINIESEGTEYLTFELWSLNGQKLLQRELDNQSNINLSIPISNLASGMYIIKINNKEGQNLYASKIIKR